MPDSIALFLHESTKKSKLVSAFPNTTPNIKKLNFCLDDKIVMRLKIHVAQKVKSQGFHR